MKPTFVILNIRFHSMQIPKCGRRFNATNGSDTHDFFYRIHFGNVSEIEKFIEVSRLSDNGNCGRRVNCD